MKIDDDNILQSVHSNLSVYFNINKDNITKDPIVKPVVLLSFYPI